MQMTPSSPPPAPGQADAFDLLNRIEELFAKAPAFAPRSLTGRKLHLLVVEDDHFMRQTVTLLLNDPRLILHFATTIEDAAQQYLELQPHMLFLDIGMPDASGMEFLKVVYRYDAYAHVIMMTGNAEVEAVLQAKSHGAKGYVTKPLNGQKLFECVQRYVKS